MDENLEPILRELEADLAKYKGLSVVMFWVRGNPNSKIAKGIAANG